MSVAPLHRTLEQELLALRAHRGLRHLHLRVLHRLLRREAQLDLGSQAS